jgi:hypothetical protein
MIQFFSALAILWIAPLASAVQNTPEASCSREQIGRAISIAPLAPLQSRALIEASVRRSSPAYAARFDVTPRLVIYCTTDSLNEPVPASGLWLVPSQAQDRSQLPPASQIISYQQGTKTDRSLSPSNLSQREGQVLLSMSAMLGATIVAADYIGLSPEFTGLPSRFHPYLHQETSANTVIDLIHAVETARGNQASAVYLTGYSQGGYVTLAAAKRMIVLGGEWEKKLKGVAPNAGPYDLARRTFEESLANPCPHTSNLFFAYTFLGYNRTYGITSRLSDVYLPEYSSTVESLFDGKHSFSEVNDTLPALPSGLFRPGFLAGIGGDTLSVSEGERESAEKGRLARQALQQNSLLDGSFGTALRNLPFRFSHALDDELVPSSSMIVAAQVLKAN